MLILRRSIRRAAPSSDNCHLICDPDHKNAIVMRQSGARTLTTGVVVTCIAVVVIVIAILVFVLGQK